MNKITILLIFIFISCPLKAENNIVTYGLKSQSTKINIKVYSSLTCPYCAEFHLKILPNIIKKYVSSEQVYIELHDYPLDQGALIAAQVQKCFSIKDQKLFLDEIYKTQSKWGAAKSLKDLEYNLSEITKPLNLDNEKFKKCIKNKDFETIVLKSRINAQNKYDINSTPTLIINEKKYKGKLKNIDKYIQKLL
tara:strand:- start:31406 stop:31984 length:579 start_codon:yes stop_codon:yes gene_type:complete